MNTIEIDSLQIDPHTIHFIDGYALHPNDHMMYMDDQQIQAYLDLQVRERITYLNKEV